ncbi:hypothetical protein FNF28_02321 [Cafeteria roenbergensis]|uniref:Uncharacterized protein n=1 Tax=Cafeteria roenbergensis TaxID=33653 RepID=A0A5A8DTQ9_CAFRO|nr:hypothetical protein FNF28_02321 [Cafeteria roenbergensis]
MWGERQRLRHNDSVGADSRAGPVTIGSMDKAGINSEAVGTESFADAAFYLRIASVLKLGTERRVEMADLPPLLRMDTTGGLAHELAGTDPAHPLWWRLYVSMRDRVSLAAVGAVLHAGLSVAVPMAVRLIVDGVQQRRPEAVWYPFVAFALHVSSTFCNQQAQGIGFRVGQRARAILTSLIYDAAAKLRQGEWAAVGSSQGAVGTMLSNDATKLFELGPFMHAVWVAPCMIIVACALLYTALGVGAIAALVVMAGLVPLSAMVARAVQSARLHHLRVTDQRLKAVNEFLGSVKTSKLYSWERAWRDRIDALRAQEMSWMFRENVFFGLAIALLIMGPVLGALAAFATHTLTGGELSSGLAFQSLGLISVLRFPLQQMANAMTSATHARAALGRIEGFLRSVDRVVAARGAAAAEAEAVLTPAETVAVAPVRYSWPRSAHAAAASAAAAKSAAGTAGGRRNDKAGTPGPAPTRAAARGGEDDDGRAEGGFAVTLPSGLSVRPGELLLVCGRVASGKSTLLAGLLGEAEAEALATADSCPAAAADGSPAAAAEAAEAAASLALRGGCAFAAQTAFLLSASVRENIVFGRSWHEGRYRRAVWAACLAEDLVEMPAGDATAVGEEGLVTSGGQRARIALARALYEDIGVCIADDVISALDAGTASRVARRALGPRGILRRSARVLATHAVHLGCLADQVLALDGGRVIYQGPWSGFEGTDAHRSLLEAEAEEDGVSVDQLSAAGSAAAGGGEVSHEGRAAAKDAADEAAADAAACLLDPSDEAAAWWAVDLSGGRGSASGIGHDATGVTARLLAPETAAPATATAAASAPPRDDEASAAAIELAPVGGGAASRADAAAKPLTAPGGEAAAPVGSKIMTEEARERGRTSCASICLWLRGAGGWWWAGAAVLALSLERVSFVSADFWLSNWATQADVAAGREPASSATAGLVQLNLPPLTPDSAQSVYLAGYTGIVAVTLLAVLCRTLVFPLMCWVAAGSSFRWILWAVLRAPFRFFETTPRGRILSRLSYDVEIVDFVLQTKLQPAVASVGWLASGLGVLAGVMPWMAVAFVPLGALWGWLQQRFSHAVRDLQRLDSASRSPVQTHFGETISGAPTIRAYRKLDRFAAAASALIDANSRAVCGFVDANRWLGIRVDALGSLVLLTAGLLAVAMQSQLTGGMVGLALTWCFNMTISLNFCIVYFTELEARLTSVERLCEFVTSIPREPALGGDEAADAAFDPPPPGCLDCACLCPRASRPVPRGVAAERAAKRSPAAVPPPGWPSEGRVVFDKAVMRYRPELDPALKGMDLEVAPGRRVGIVGKTGSGKSSTLAALFRSVELDSGSILVDGVDVATIGLSSVRGATGGLVIIPQEPSLFEGSLRESLDPFGAFSDAAVWRAICQAGLGAYILHREEQERSEPARRRAVAAVSISSILGPSPAAEAAPAERVAAALALHVEDGGSNFSAGTRQLVCLARALLRAPKVLVLDEATASVDPATDQLFQGVLRSRFRGTTCLIVAHRLDTIMDCDTVCVVSAGQAAEAGSPLDLLLDPASLFHALVHARGSEEAARLLEVAKAASEGSVAGEAAALATSVRAAEAAASRG